LNVQLAVTNCYCFHDINDKIHIVTIRHSIIKINMDNLIHLNINLNDILPIWLDVPQHLLFSNSGKVPTARLLELFLN
jgi:hypothetical protein